MRKVYNKGCLCIYYDTRIVTDGLTDELQQIVQNNEFIFIEDMDIIPENEADCVKYLKEFCNIMTVSNIVIIFDAEKFTRRVETSYSDSEYVDELIEAICNILTEAGFSFVNDEFYNTSEVYVYTNSKLGDHFCTLLEKEYGPGYNE